MLDESLVPNKPELTQKEIQMCGTARKILQEQNIDKIALADRLGFDGSRESKDRKIRDLISKVAQHYPVISLSGSKGYRIANNDFNLADVVDCFHQLKDFGSRMWELEKRCKPLEKYLQKYMALNNITSYAQLQNELILLENESEE